MAVCFYKYKVTRKKQKKKYKYDDMKNKECIMKRIYYL